MEVFRLSREKYAVPLSGIGAAIRGARWNSTGVELIYTAGNRSLAMAEIAVHLTLATMPDDYFMLTIHIPDHIEVQEISEKNLPEDWKEFPHPVSTQKIGNDFISRKKFCVLKIPSVVTQGDFNFLINPNHNAFAKIKVIKMDKFPFDNRIFQ